MRRALVDMEVYRSTSWDECSGMHRSHEQVGGSSVTIGEEPDSISGPDGLHGGSDRAEDEALSDTVFVRPSEAASFGEMNPLRSYGFVTGAIVRSVWRS